MLFHLLFQTSILRISFLDFHEFQFLALQKDKDNLGIVKLGRSTLRLVSDLLL